MIDKPFSEKFICQNSGDEKDIREAVLNILAIEDKMRDLKAQKAELEADLITLDKSIRWEMTPELTISIRQTTKFKANKDKICDLFSIPEDFKRLLASQPFNKGPIKKDEKFSEGEDWEEITEDRFSLSKVNPQIIRDIVYRQKNEAEYLAGRKEA